MRIPRKYRKNIALNVPFFKNCFFVKKRLTSNRRAMRGVQKGVRTGIRSKKCRSDEDKNGDQGETGPRTGLGTG